MDDDLVQALPQPPGFLNPRHDNVFGESSGQAWKESSPWSPRVAWDGRARQS